METNNKLDNVSINKLLKVYEQSENIKKQQKEYKQTHKELINACSKKYYEKIKNDPEFIEKRKKQKKEYYQRKKLEKENEKNV
jgi:hypothetical protein